MTTSEAPAAPARGEVDFARPPHLIAVVAFALAALTLKLGIDILTHEGPPPVRMQGLYAGEDADRAERLLGRFAKALVAMQQVDGSFYAGAEEVGEQGVHERLASTALATAALARLRTSGVALPDVDLDGALSGALAHLQANQTDDGAIGKLAVGPEQKFFQIDATSAALYAFVTVGDVQAIEAAKGAAPALAGFAKAGLRNGWPRSLAAMTVAQVFDQRRQALFPREAGRVVRGRQVGEKDGVDFQVTEALVRTVLQPGTSVVDAFPGKVQAALLADPPFWRTMQSDVQLWWMKTWLVARSEAPGPWFTELVRTLEEEAILADGRVPGGYFADTLVQTAAAILAILEGWA
ncbi:MAG: hypothetical protein QNJ98_04370 [Planctomycetota bacterium]|nr:hypothetical protein [Planctomycetota bacterium]